MLIGLLLWLFIPVEAGFTQQIIIDGKTNTSLTIEGNNTTVSTKTIKNNNAFNSFNQFNVDEKNTVNLLIPDNVRNLINLINAKSTIINGTVNSVKDNKIGGNVYLVNPYGITIGKKGIINVGSFFALTPNIEFANDIISPAGKIDDFSVSLLLNGQMPINQDASIIIEGDVNSIESVYFNSGSLINTGNIITGIKFSNDNIDTEDLVNTENIETASERIIQNGEIYLSASKNIINSGKIVSLGESYSNSENITISSNETISLEDSSQIYARDRNENNSINISGNNVSVKGLLDVSGESGGSITVNANNLNLEGDLIATGRTGSGGNITLQVQNASSESQNSTLNVSGFNGGKISNITKQQTITSANYIARGNNASGGNIDITSSDLNFKSAQINASGKTNGGVIRIGGEYKGGSNSKSDDIPNSKTLFIDNRSNIIANSTGNNGNGGTIIVWSDEKTIAHNNFYALPGKISGCGGFVEISSSNILDYNGYVQTGIGDRFGQVLLDPKDIIISAFGIVDILNNNEYSEIPALPAILSNDAIATLLESPQEVILQANNDIILTDPIFVNNLSGDGGNLTLQAGRSIIISANITTDNGNLNIYANDTIANGVINAQRDPGNADITLTPGFNINTGTGSVNIEIRNDNTKTNNDSGNIIINNIIANTIFIDNNGPTANSNVIISAGASINASGNNDSIIISSTNGNLINSEGPSALNAPSGRWLVYSSNPIFTDENGLVYSKLYSSSLTTNPPGTIPAGDYILYSYSPVLTWSLQNMTKQYGSVNPVFTPIITGYIDGDTSSSLTNTLQILSSANTSSPVGTYPIYATNGILQSTLNYSFNIDGLIVNSLNLTGGGTLDLNNTLSVLPVPLTVQANNFTKTEGSANPDFSSNLTGFVLNETESVLNGNLNYSTLANTLSPPGTYSIRPYGL
ncbi:MAG: leukotoxin LktA family filamentous adhesin, partial [Cyanobacteriota bacterium]